MNIWKAIPQRWQKLGITTKFGLAFGLLLALIVLVAITSYVALTMARRQTEATILTSTEIQRLVLEMEGNLEEARRHERGFFLRYPTLGFSESYQIHVGQAQAHIVKAMALSTELQGLIEESEVSDALRESDVNLNLYFSAASRYAVSFDEAVELVAQLATPETGLEAKVRQYSTLLLDTLQTAGDPGLIIWYHQMQSFEKDYWLTRQRPLMQSAFNTAVPLREAIELVPTLEAEQKAQALTYLDNYLATAEEVLKLDVAIRSKFNEFDLQAEAIDPISAELIILAREEVKHARSQIEQTSRAVTGILVVVTMVGLLLSGMIARMLNNSITRNVVELTQVAGEFQAGNLEARARIDSADEIGQLADSFNAMATRISSLVGSLEQKVAERTVALTTANEQLQQEITEHKRTEEAFREAERNLNKAQEIAHIGSWEWDVASGELNWSKEMYRIFGRDPKQFTPTSDTVLEVIHPDDREANLMIIAEALTKNQSINIEYRIILSNGEERYVHAIGEMIIDEKGNPIEAVGVFQDITERKQAEEALKEYSERLEEMAEERTKELTLANEQLQQEIIERKQAEEALHLQSQIAANMAEGVQLIRADDGGIIYTNPRFEEMFGYGQGELIDEHVSVLNAPGDRSPEETAEEIIKSLNETGVWHGEVHNIKKNGTPFWCRASVTTLDHADHGKIWIAVHEDITEHKALRERLIRHEKLAILGQLAGSVAHELRNPLGVLTNAIYFLTITLTEADDTTREYLEMISAQVRKADKIISDLLSFSHTRLGERAEREAVAVSELVAQVLVKQPPPEQVEVSTQIDPDLPPVFVDPEQMGQVLTNLITNAYQAMLEAGRLTIKGEEAENQVRLSVVDTGCGISKENMGKLFEPLFTTKPKAIGLGLAVCKNLVEANEGSIEMESKEGKGSTFTVTIPTKEVAA